MQNDADGRDNPLSLSPKYQALTVAGFAIAMGLAISLVSLLLLVPNSGRSAEGQGPKPTYFVPSTEQASSMHLETVGLRRFYTETIADGYVAANGGWGAKVWLPKNVAPGIPVLATQSSDLLQAGSDLMTAEAQLRIATVNEERQRKLYQVDGAALKDWQQSQADLTTATVSLEAARNKLRVLGKSDQEIGNILHSMPKAAGGQPGSGQVFAVGDLSIVWLVANVREADALRIHKGDLAEVHIPALSDRIIHVRISYISSTIDPVTHRLVVGGVYRNDHGELRPNMLATLDIAGQGAAEAPAVPDSAIIHEGDQSRAWVVNANGQYSLRQLSVGRSQAGYAEVLHGISAGERVVTSGALFVDQANTDN